MPSFPRRKLLLATTILAAAALAAYVVVRPAAPPSAPPPADMVTVVLDGKTCQPPNLTAPAGRTTFLIRNLGPKTTEWEILQGNMVLEERENIAPGQSQTMTVTLEPGVYDITCSAKSKFIADLRGKLTVTGDASAAKPRPAELIGALAEYRFTVYEEAGELVDKTAALAEAVKAGDVAAARALYAPARVHYERIEPVAELFADLDGAIDSRADDHEKREADPGFTGFHRLEYALWAENSLQGMGVVADKLVADVTELQSRLRALDIPPGRMAGGAALLMEEVAATKISGEEERYSRTDLWDIAANVDGAERIVALLRPLLVKADAPLVERIEGKLVAVRAVLAGYALPESGYRSYDTLTEADRNALRASVTALAEDLSRLRGTLGLD